MGKGILSILSLIVGIIFVFSIQASAIEFPTLDLSADCFDDTTGGYYIEYSIVADTNIGVKELSYSLTISGDVISGNFLSNSGLFVESYPVDVCGDYAISGFVEVVDFEWYWATLPNMVVTCTCDGGTEGCTPGYWKNHLDAWLDYSPDDDFDTVFGVDFFSPDITLGDAVRLGGGGIKKIARHGTAALLSAVDPNVDYPFTVAEVILAVQNGDPDAIDVLVDANELGCPLD